MMPWLSILLSLISFVLSKKTGASNGQAALVAGAAGLGTYYVTHETTWGQQTLGAYDGYESPPTSGVDADGQPIETTTGTNGVVVPVPTAGSNGVTGLLSDTLKAAAPVATTGAILGAALANASPWFWAALIAGFYVFTH